MEVTVARSIRGRLFFFFFFGACVHIFPPPFQTFTLVWVNNNPGTVSKMLLRLPFSLPLLPFTSLFFSSYVFAFHILFLFLIVLLFFFFLLLLLLGCRLRCAPSTASLCARRRDIAWLPIVTRLAAGRLSLSSHRAATRSVKTKK